jgi:hypothetical protein
MDFFMTTGEIRESVLSSDEATFWLDGRGRWCNQHGPFQHRKIIDYFHKSIGRDETGYFVSHINGATREKVYFRYEDTALFVFDVMPEAMVLVLNTGRRISLDPAALFIRHDCLYARQGDELIKFTEQSMVKIARCMVADDDGCNMIFNGKHVAIPVEDHETLSGNAAGPPGSEAGLAAGSEGAKK